MLVQKLSWEDVFADICNKRETAVLKHMNNSHLTNIWHNMKTRRWRKTCFEHGEILPIMCFGFLRKWFFLVASWQMSFEISKMILFYYEDLWFSLKCIGLCIHKGNGKKFPPPTLYLIFFKFFFYNNLVQTLCMQGMVVHASKKYSCFLDWQISLLV